MRMALGKEPTRGGRHRRLAAGRVPTAPTLRPTNLGTYLSIYTSENAQYDRCIIMGQSLLSI